MIEQLIVNKKIDFGISYVPLPSPHIEISEIGKYHMGCYYLKGAFSGKSISELPFAFLLMDCRVML